MVTSNIVYLYVSLTIVHVVEYEGYVHRVEQERVLMKFSKKFSQKFIKGMKFSVRFSFSRTQIRRAHQAIGIISSCDAIIIPSSNHLVKNPVIPKSLPSSFSREPLNEEQTLAACSIVYGTQKVPYMIFGPPGTGKTRTLVSALVGVFHSDKSSTFLVSTPSNFAADVVCDRLSKMLNLSSKEMLRLNGYQRPKDTVSTISMKHSM